MNPLADKVSNEFTKRFEGEKLLLSAPGRVNLLGGHTDYNDGFVLPAAVDRDICFAMATNSSGQIRLYSIDKDDFFEININSISQTSQKRWPAYILGVVDQLREHDYTVGGFDCVFSGNVPMGAGMSSSAALESGIIFGLNQLFNLNIAPEKMAQIAQKAENEFVGVQCGIMDQFISLNGKADHIMKLDCRSLDYTFYPFEYPDIHFLICDTQVRHVLGSSEYNQRRKQCMEGVRILRQYDESIKSLRDVSAAFLMNHKSEINSTVYKRCAYVIDENTRVLKACKDLEKGDLPSFGRRMYASHTGLRDQYEVSCKELDILVEASLKTKGVLGARMMGGGFGGCTINLVKDKNMDAFKKKLTQVYKQKTDKEVKIYQTKVSGGTHLLKKVKIDSSNV